LRSAPGQAKRDCGHDRTLRGTAAGRSAAMPARAAPARMSSMSNVAIRSAPRLPAVSMTVSYQPTLTLTHRAAPFCHGPRRRAIHVFPRCRQQSRGWPACAGHDDEAASHGSMPTPVGIIGCIRGGRTPVIIGSHRHTKSGAFIQHCEHRGCVGVSVGNRVDSGRVGGLGRRRTLPLPLQAWAAKRTKAGGWVHTKRR